MIEARVIANEILIRAWEEGLDLTQIDIQKIMYFLHGHHLVDHGAPLIKSEFEAWEYGPVQRIVYDEFKKFGDEPITVLAEKFDQSGEQGHRFLDLPIMRQSQRSRSISINTSKSRLLRLWISRIDRAHLGREL